MAQHLEQVSKRQYSLHTFWVQTVFQKDPQARNLAGAYNSSRCEWEGSLPGLNMFIIESPKYQHEELLDQTAITIRHVATRRISGHVGNWTVRVQECQQWLSRASVTSLLWCEPGGNHRQVPWHASHSRSSLKR